MALLLPAAITVAGALPLWIPAAPPQCSGSALVASDAKQGDAFGKAVSIDGARAVIGAFGDDPGGAFSGSAYVYLRTPLGWTVADKLTAPDGSLADYFGYAVAIARDQAAVGAWGHDGAGLDAGFAYVFRESGTAWQHVDNFYAPDAAPGDWFGRALAMSPDWSLVGAPGVDGPGQDSGAVYAFEFAPGGWTSRGSIAAPDGAADDWFGSSVALAGSRAIVGAPQPLGGGPGAAYVFRRTGTAWVFEAKLVASDGAQGDRFGHAVALAGSRAVVGADGHDGACAADPDCDSGAAYVFEFDGTSWQETALLKASDASPKDRFGYAVSLLQGDALVGSPASDAVHQDGGAVYVFRGSGSAWQQQAVLIAPEGGTGGSFGHALSQSDPLAIAGAFASGGGVGSVRTISVDGTGPIAELDAQGSSVSLSQGGTQQLQVRSCPQWAGQVYWIVGTATGTSPGVVVGSHVLPLNPDLYGLYTILYPNNPPLADSVGLLDAQGRATAHFTTTPGLLPQSLAGTVLHHAVAVLHIDLAGVQQVSQAVPVVLTP